LPAPTSRKEATEAGADHVGGDEIVEKIIGGWMDFDAVVATPDMMRAVGRLGKVLGPRGLMPNPKTGTVTPNVAQAIKEIKAGKVEFRVDKTGIVHAPVGKTSFSTENLVANAHALVNSVVRGQAARGQGQVSQVSHRVLHDGARRRESTPRTSRAREALGSWGGQPDEASTHNRTPTTAHEPLQRSGGRERRSEETSRWL
jgi:hypothetical protein